MAHEELVLTGNGTLHKVTRDDYGVKHNGAPFADDGASERLPIEQLKKLKASAKHLCPDCFPGAGE